MRRFLLKGVLFLAIGWALATLLARISLAVAPTVVAEQYVGVRMQIEGLMERSREVEALAVGNSHNLALDFSALDQAGYHVWWGGRDAIETRHVLEALFPSLPHVRTVYMTASYAIFKQNNRKNPEFTMARRQVYASIPTWRMMPRDWRNYLLGKLHPIFPVDFLKRDDHWRRVFRALIRGPQSWRKLTYMHQADGQFGLPQYLECTPRAAEELTEDAGAALALADPAARARSVTANPNVDAESYAALVALIQKAQAHGMRLVFYTPPYFRAYTEAYDPATIAQMKATMRDFQDEFGVEYYDFSLDEELTSNSRLFLDSHHLNSCGARLFSAKLKQAMQDGSNEH